MGIFDAAMAFIEGIKSVIDVSGTVQGTISDSVSDGIERAFLRIKKPLEQSLIRVSLVFVGVFFMVWGFALFLENFMLYHGLGFVIAGAGVGAVVLLSYQERNGE
ncbi:MAG: hypothetical protein WC263_00600 [Candidatus Micrarchaeia archaeon]|jgi:hypothetical protein